MIVTKRQLYSQNGLQISQMMQGESRIVVICFISQQQAGMMLLVQIHFGFYVNKPYFDHREKYHEWNSLPYEINSSIQSTNFLLRI